MIRRHSITSVRISENLSLFYIVVEVVEGYLSAVFNGFVYLVYAVVYLLVYGFYTVCDNNAPLKLICTEVACKVGDLADKRP